MEWITQHWDKIAAAIFGGGVVYGGIKADNAGLRSTDARLEKRIQQLEADLMDHQLTCPVKIHEKLNTIAEDVSYIKGLFDAQRRER